MEESDFVLVNSILSEGNGEVSREEAYIWIRALYMLGMYEEYRKSEQTISKTGMIGYLQFSMHDHSHQWEKEDSVIQYEKMISEFPEKGGLT